MAGLLGDDFDDPRTLALLQFAGALGNQRSRGFGGLLSGLNAGGQEYIGSLARAKKAAQEEEFRKAQMQEVTAQMEERKARAAKTQRDAVTQQADEGLMRRLVGMPVEQAMPQGQQGPGLPQRNPGIDPRAFMNQGGSLDGLTQAMNLSRAMNPQAEKPVISSPGQIARHPVTGEIVWENPAAPIKAPAAPTSVQEFNYGRENPAFNDWLLRGKKAGATNVTVSGAAQEKEESKTVGKYFGEQYGKIQDAGFSANKTIGRLNNLESLLSGYETGKLTPLGTDIAAYATSVGFKIDPKLGNKQAAEAITNEMALELRNPSGGAGMPGALTDKDREFLVKMTAGLGKDPQANKLIIEIRRKLAKRDVEVAKMARAYRQKRGGMDDGFLAELEQFSEANPLFEQAGGVGLSESEAAELAKLRVRFNRGR